MNKASIKQHIQASTSWIPTKGQVVDFSTLLLYLQYCSVQAVTGASVPDRHTHTHTHTHTAAGFAPAIMNSWVVAVTSVPLLPAVVVAFTHHSHTVAKRCCDGVAWMLRLLRGNVCPRSTHAFVFSQCTHGKAESVLEAFDLYADTHPSASIGPRMGEALDEVVRRVRPTRVLELGTHCGYSAVSLLRLLPPAGRLITVEQDPQVADLGEEIILVAGFKHAHVLTGKSCEVIPQLHSYLEPTQETGGGFDLVLMDHDPSLYLLDLLALEREELLCPSGCSVVVIFRNHRDKSLEELKELVRNRQDCYRIKSQLDGMMEIFFEMQSTKAGSSNMTH
ncbi:transmembrane O-methyltransferase homolog isoform X2 [Dunckerocampus dactyliophorus]|uniref:transmembrane O-methyltransferase homolog isoform X2 n=1 Tax=Dunckerocampus dactyliophorus TaxID=161453 RepID=UPI0024064C87|nr:transmembrane O-methyltransferase homolog isoform X2 [Dunckerocampus dactyliophorus]